MATTHISAKHIKNLAQLPEKLIIGRAYFIDDEHYIVIDHGNGPVIYGNKAGAQGQPGEPIPILQAQIDSLTEASFKHLALIMQIDDRTREKEKSIENDIDEEALTRLQRDRALQENISVVDSRRVENLQDIYEQFSKISQAQIQLANLTQTLAENLQATENIFLNFLIENEKYNRVVPIQTVDTLSVEGYTWDIAADNATANDGTLIFTIKS